MSDQPNPTDAKEEVSAEAVARYLLAHPEFFIEHEELVDQLQIPHRSGAAISLVAHQVTLFRAQRDEFKRQLSELIETARQNDRFFEKSKRLLIHLLEARSLEEVIIVLEDSFRNDFQVEFCSLTLFGEPDRYPASGANIIPQADAQAQLGSLLDSRKAVCGHFQQEQLALLFPQHHAQIGSAAVIPLRYNDTLGMLAIGSDDVDYFDSSMGSLFLSYISDSLSRLLPPLLAQERQDEPSVALATR